jgi:hypothetical protein
VKKFKSQSLNTFAQPLHVLFPDPNHVYIYSPSTQQNVLLSIIDQRDVLRQSSIMGSLLEMRFNFATNSEALQAFKFLNLPVAMRILSSMLFCLGLYGTSGYEVCQSSLIGMPKFVLYGNDDSGNDIIPGAAA